MRIGIIGNGNVGARLGTLFDRAGHDIIMGVRDDSPARAGRSVPVAEAAAAEVVILAVPYAALGGLLDEQIRDALAGRVVVDATNPVQPDWSPVELEQGESASTEIARLVPGATVVKAFNTVFADSMTPDGLDRDGQRVTTFLAGDDRAAVDTVAALAQASGFDPVVTGDLSTAWLLEAVAHLNIAIALGQQGGTGAAFIYHRG